MTDVLKDRNDIHEIGPLDVSLVAEAKDGNVHVNGTVSVTIHFVCSRCLCEFTQRLDVPVDELLTRDQELADADEEDRIHLIQSNSIDLIPYVEENVVLAIPFVVLCQEDCKGLCIHCGQNKNEDNCGCKVEKLDPRLEGLKALKFD